MTIVTVGAEVNGSYEHQFAKNSDTNSNLYSNGIMEGNYVLISTNKRTAIAAGFVSDINVKTINVFLER